MLYQPMMSPLLRHSRFSDWRMYGAERQVGLRDDDGILLFHQLDSQQLMRIVDSTSVMREMLPEQTLARCQSENSRTAVAARLKRCHSHWVDARVGGPKWTMGTRSSSVDYSMVLSFAMMAGLGIVDSRTTVQGSTS